ncbi:30S ribosomal protein S18 [Candidatus Peregrinibacteria bacterium]|nr:30S ribosomal protein S18 [Candidatus Peregrinibacteria bacterium]MBT7736795.1 30S ribosomal protein S18 [Candidatus Peregrinibacteria bacterium]
MPTYKGRKCQFCDSNINYIDYKNINLLQKFITQYKKIAPKYYKGTCLKHQKRLSNAIKNARIVALAPFTPK